MINNQRRDKMRNRVSSILWGIGVLMGTSALVLDVLGEISPQDFTHVMLVAIFIVVTNQE